MTGRANDVGELKRFAVMHAKAQGITGYRNLLARIDHDGTGPGSWVGEWAGRGDELRRAGRTLAASRHYNMARFPFVDTDARRAALEQCVDTFAAWAAGHRVERLDVPVPGGAVRCWTTPRAAGPPRPLVVMCGGIVSIKEQWATALAAMPRFGFAGVVLELPGVGENPLRYDEDSAALLSRVIDAVADRADVSATYALMFSFGGHLALRCAGTDPRIRGVVTANAPVHEFFTDDAWHARVPAVTRATLAHLTGVGADDLAGHLTGWALSPELLRGLDIPVAYAASARDEIIPAGEVRALREHVRDLDLVTHDDTHGSPRHVAENRLWSIRSVLRMRGGQPVRTHALGLALRAVRLAGPRRTRRELT